MGGDAGARYGHAEPEGEGGERQYPAYRADMRVGWQAFRLGDGQPGAHHQRIAGHADGQRQQDRQHAARVALVE